MNWGKWIIVAFILFAGFIVTLVTVCMRQDVSLVSKEYYQEELAYQQQIARLVNARELKEKPMIEKRGDALEITFQHFNKLKEGSIKLFRPSDPKLDRSFRLEPNDEGKQSISVNGLDKGMYRARMQWTMDGKEYFIETVVNI